MNMIVGMEGALVGGERYCICVFVYLCICIFVHLKGTNETEDEYDCRNGGSTCRRGALLRADHDVGVEPWKRERGS